MMDNRKIVISEDMKNALTAVSVHKGQTVMVHASLCSLMSQRALADSTVKWIGENRK